VHCRDVVPERPKKVKGIIHWLADESAAYALFELYEDMDVSTPKQVRCGYVGADIWEAAVGTVFQFERVGFFRLDRREMGVMPVFIRITGLLDKYNGAAK